jgi:YMGG-like Gly-zipper
MRACYRTVAVTTILSLVASSAIGQAPIIYPSKGQTAQQQQKDEGECAAWAKQTTGIDPAVLAATPTVAAAPPPPPPTQTQPASGERARGAVRGAAVGAVVGEIANDDAGEGAAYGAAAGAVAAGSRQRRDQRNQQEQAAQQQQQAAAQQKAAQDQAEAKKKEQLSTYNRANAACLEGRGYTLK